MPSKEISKIFKYILLLFFSTRLILVIIALVSRTLLLPYHLKPAIWIYSDKIWLDIWGVWDSGWYLSVAQGGYPHLQGISGESNYGFFPLYPLLIKLTSFLTGNYFIAGIIVSNIAFLGACLLFYFLVKLNYDEETARASIKYLFLSPAAFILSGVFAESVYLFLAIACFYYAKKEKWWIAGVAGFFISVARPGGVLIFLPILYEYFKTKEFKFPKIRFDALWLLLIPLGLLSFCFYCQHQTGDFFAYTHIKTTAWKTHMMNPLDVLWYGLTYPHIGINFLAAWMLIGCILIPIVFYRLGFSYGLFALYSVILPLSCMITDLSGATRYLLPIFPFYILLAQLHKRKGLDEAVSMSLALMQGFLMIFWACGFGIVK